MVSAQAPQPPFTSIAKGDMSGQQTAKQVTVRTPAEWKALWKDHAPTEKMPNVDFSKNMVVGIFLGSKPSAGNEVEIVGVRTQDKDLIVEYVQKQPGRGTMAAQILTEPYHLVSVPTHAGHGPIHPRARDEKTVSRERRAESMVALCSQLSALSRISTYSVPASALWFASTSTPA